MAKQQSKHGQKAKQLKEPHSHKVRPTLHNNVQTPREQTRENEALTFKRTAMRHTRRHRAKQESNVASASVAVSIRKNGIWGMANASRQRLHGAHERRRSTYAHHCVRIGLCTDTQHHGWAHEMYSIKVAGVPRNHNV